MNYYVTVEIDMSEILSMIEGVQLKKESADRMLRKIKKNITG